MTVHINFDIEVAPPIEEQLRSQGATLGIMADQIQNALKYCECLYVWGYLTQGEANRANERIVKDVRKNVRPIETETA